MEKIYYYVFTKVDSDGSSRIYKTTEFTLMPPVASVPDGYVVWTRVSKNVYDSLNFKVI